MAEVRRFLKWVRQIWRKMTNWVQFWKCKTKPSVPDQPKKHSLKEKIASDFDPSKMVKSHKEPKIPDLDVCPGVLEPSVLATVKDTPAVPGKSRSLMQLSQNVVHSVSTLMVSALQSGWRLCKWKSMSSATISSRMKSGSALETPEAEMLREVYLVLWVIRKQLRELARRQERRRQRRMRSHVFYARPAHPTTPIQCRASNRTPEVPSRQGSPRSLESS